MAMGWVHLQWKNFRRPGSFLGKSWSQATGEFASAAEHRRFGQAETVKHRFPDLQKLFEN
jgi:hypothetical protein